MVRYDLQAQQSTLLPIHHENAVWCRAWQWNCANYSVSTVSLFPSQMANWTILDCGFHCQCIWQICVCHVQSSQSINFITWGERILCFWVDCLHLFCLIFSKSTPCCLEDSVAKSVSFFLKNIII